MKKRPAPQPKPSPEPREIGNGLAVLKIRNSGTGGYAVTLPRHLCNQLQMLPGMSFVSVRAVGPCLVVSRVTDVSSPEATRAEADEKVEKLLVAWRAGDQSGHAKMLADGESK